MANSTGSTVSGVTVSSVTELDALLSDAAANAKPAKRVEEKAPALPRGRPQTFKSELAAAVLARRGAIKDGGVSEDTLRAVTGWTGSTLTVQVSHIRQTFGVAIGKLGALGTYYAADPAALAAAVRSHCETFSDKPMSDDSAAALARVVAILDAE